jgi:hypothetical protein
VALAGSQKSTTIIAVAIPVVSFGLPILDVALAIARRFLGGKPIFLGDDDHIHHKLLQRGLSQREAVLVLYGVTAGFGLLSLVLLQDRATLAVILVVIGLGAGFGVQQLRYAEFSELFSLAQRTFQPRRFIAGNLRIRRATDALDRCGDFAAVCRALRETLEPLGFDGFAFECPRAGILSDWSFAPLRQMNDGSLQYAWNGFGLETAKPGWELAFELLTPSGERWGEFRLFRRHFDEPLFFDLNLLNGGFREQLADAAARSMLRCLPASEIPASAEAQLATSATIAR